MTGRPTDDSSHLHDLVAELTRRVESLEAENQALRGATETHRDPESDVEPSSPAVSRRRAIMGLGAAAVAAAGAAVAGKPDTAAAATGQPVLQGQSNTFTSALGTYLTNEDGRAMALFGNDYALYAVGYDSAGVRAYGYASQGLVATGLDIPAGSGKEGVIGQSGNSGYAGVKGENSTSGYGVYGTGGSGVRGRGSAGDGVRGETYSTAGKAGVSGYCDYSVGFGVRGIGPIGVQGEANETDGTGIRGIAQVEGGVGGKFGGNRAALNLVPRSTAGKPTTGAHARGDIVIDNTGKMFICTQGGTPGTWVRVNTTAA
jgi:hypothetical protein